MYEIISEPLPRQRAGAAAEQCTGQGAAGEGAEPAHGSRSASATDAKPGGRGQRASGAVGPAACEAADAEAAAAVQAAMHAAGACKVEAQNPCPTISKLLGHGVSGLPH